MTTYPRIKLVPGDDWSETVTFLDSNGDARDLTGWTVVVAQVAWNAGLGTLDLTTDLADMASGILAYSATDAETAPALDPGYGKVAGLTIQLRSPTGFDETPYYAEVEFVRSKSANSATALTPGAQGPAGINWRDDVNSGTWLTGTDYAARDGVYLDGSSYRAIQAHTSAAATEPGTGASWQTVWEVIALGANEAEVAIVAGLASEIATLAGIEAEIQAVSGISAQVQAVAAIDTDVTAVAGIAGNVTTVAGIAADVTTVAGVYTDVAALAAISDDIEAVAGIAANVTTVAGMEANVGTVAGLSTEVAALAAIAADITTVAGISTELQTVASLDTEVTTLAGISSDISAVSAVADDVTTVADNLAAILATKLIEYPNDWYNLDESVIPEGGWAITRYAARAFNLQKLFAEVTHGAAGESLDFEIYVDGLSVYGPETVTYGTTLLVDDLDIDVDEGAIIGIDLKNFVGTPFGFVLNLIGV